MPSSESNCQWFSQQEAADHLGYSVRTIRNYIAQGLLPAYRSKGGRGIRVRGADLDGLFERVPTVSRECEGLR